MTRRPRRITESRPTHLFINNITIQQVYWESLLPILPRLATRDHKDMCYKDEDCGESYDDEDAKRVTGNSKDQDSREEEDRMGPSRRAKPEQ